MPTTPRPDWAIPLVDRLSAAVQARSDAAALVDELVEEARLTGWSWDRIAGLLGENRETLRRRYRENS